VAGCAGAVVRVRSQSPRLKQGVLELLELGVDGVDLALEVNLALRHSCDLHLAGRQPLRGRALFSEARVALFSRDGRASSSRSSSASVASMCSASVASDGRSFVVRSRMSAIRRSTPLASVSSAVSCCSRRPTSSSMESCSPVSEAIFCDRSSESCCAASSASSHLRSCSQLRRPPPSGRWSRRAAR